MATIRSVGGGLEPAPATLGEVRRDPARPVGVQLAIEASLQDLPDLAARRPLTGADDPSDDLHDLDPTPLAPGTAAVTLE